MVPTEDAPITFRIAAFERPNMMTDLGKKYRIDTQNSHNLSCLVGTSWGKYFHPPADLKFYQKFSFRLVTN